MATTFELVVTLADGTEYRWPMDEVVAIKPVATEVPDDEPGDDDDPQRARAKYRAMVNLNLRTEPSTKDNTPFDVVPAGTVLVCFKDGQDNGGYRWLEVESGFEAGKLPDGAKAYAAEYGNTTGTRYLQYIADVPSDDDDSDDDDNGDGLPKSTVQFLAGSDTYGEYHWPAWGGAETTHQMLGVNVFPWLHFELLQHTAGEDNPKRRGEYLTHLLWNGVRFIRMYVPHYGRTPSETADQVEKVLDFMQGYWQKEKGVYLPMLAWLAFDDSFANLGCSVPGNQVYHDGHMGHYTERYYREKAYEQNYLPLVQAVMDRVGNHPSLMAVEPINEWSSVYTPGAGHNGNPVYGLEFLEAFGAWFKGQWPGVPLAAGWKNMYHADPRVGRRENADIGKRVELLQSYGRYLDICDAHVYQEEKENPPGGLGDWFPDEMDYHSDFLATRQLDRPIADIVTEYGDRRSENRPPFVNAFYERQLTVRHSAGNAHWGFAKEHHDKGFGEHNGGWDDHLSSNAQFFDAVTQIHKTMHDSVIMLQGLPPSPKASGSQG